ncbi:MAG: response regulator [bacterium]
MTQRCLHLLVVDDEEAHIEAIRRAFEAAGGGVEIQAVSTLREYRRSIEVATPDLVLMDLNLPDGRAVEVLTHPPEEGAFPILVMTSFGNQQIVVEVMKAGALDYLVKSPEAFSMLPRIVESAIREWILLRDRKQLEQQLFQAQKMEAVGRLAGGVAHDFNNLLSIIVMNAAELSARKDLTPTQADEVNDIALAAERGSNLTRQLLAFSHTQVLQMGALDLNEVVVGITKMLHRLIGEDIVLNSRPIPGEAHVWADRSMIEQILLNLAINSRDAMPEGGRLDLELDSLAVDAASAAAHAVTAGDFVCLTVRDTGCGIAPEHLPHLFEPFYTTKAVGRGTGLGLATVHGIVEQHHGWVEIESQQGKGTICHVYLPKLTQVKAPKAAVPAPVELRGGGETILVVEDDPSLRTLAVRLLEQYGYRVFEAPNGVVAAELWRIQGGAIDLLLTDVIMPGGVSGGKLAEQLLSEKPGLKVVFMSGYPGAVASRGVTFTQDMCFLQKPFASTKLIQIVRDCLDKA